MEENKRSKGYKEIFEEKYSVESCVDNPLRMIEAIGYLKCLEQFLPSEKWIREDIESILFVLALFHDVRAII